MENKEKDEKIEDLKSELRKANNKIKALEEWKKDTLNSVRAILFSFTQIPEIFSGLDDQEKVEGILEQLKQKSFPFRNVK
jgi:uncharacterized coiled-coil DUF342 family protein